MIIIKINSLNAGVKNITIHQNQKALLSNVEIRKLKGDYISDVLENDLKLFNKYRAVIISTAPGTGKTTLCEKTIVDFIKENKKVKLLLFQTELRKMSQSNEELQKNKYI